MSMMLREEDRELAARVGVVLRGMRERAGLSQRRLAEILDVTPAHVAHMERGRCLPGVARLFGFVKACGASCAEFDAALSTVAREGHAA